MSTHTADRAPQQDATAPSLSRRLREETLAEHRQAEGRPFIENLMQGTLTLADYTRYLAQLAYVYEALENRAATADDVDITRDERLRRGASIDADLSALGVSDRAAEHPPLPETLDYVSVIERASDPVAFLAHHYTRYLGDLSGGQVIATMMARHYGAQEDQLTFFRFEEIDKPVIFKRGYRDALDGLRLSDERADALIAETKTAYLANSALFDALGR